MLPFRNSNSVWRTIHAGISLNVNIDSNFRGEITSSSIGRTSAVGRLLAARPDLYLLAVATPLLLFPRGILSWLGLGILLISWLVRRISTSKWLICTPLDRPFAIIILMAPIALSVSVDLNLSLPKFYGILLGLSVFYTTVDYVSSIRRLDLALALLVVSIVAVSIIGLIGTEWTLGKYPIPLRLYSFFPKLIGEVQTSVGPATGFHPNELGGTLAFLLPVAMALLLCVKMTWWHRTALALTVLLGLGVLALSASRSAAFSLVLVVVALLVWRWRRAGLGLLLLIAILLGLTLKSGNLNITDSLLKIDAISSSADTLEGRMEVWGRALNMIEDFPFTGIGLNAFPVVLKSMYPTLLADPSSRIAHAHNIFLQTAVDFGLSGLLALIGLAAITAGVGWRACQRIGSQHLASVAALARDCTTKSSQAKVVGLLLGLLSYLVFGLTDAIPLGAKPTIFLWLMLGLVVACYRMTDKSGNAGSGPLLSINANHSAVLRAASSGLIILRDLYWIVAFLLVAIAYLVVGISAIG